MDEILILKLLIASPPLLLSYSMLVLVFSWSVSASCLRCWWTQEERSKTSVREAGEAEKRWEKGRHVWKEESGTGGGRVLVRLRFVICDFVLFVSLGVVWRWVCWGFISVLQDGSRTEEALEEVECAEALDARQARRSFCTFQVWFALVFITALCVFLIMK